MINSINIQNYKCFEQLHIPNCRRINVIVGDNGTGKTALLEAIFLALGCTSEMVLRFRQVRGLDTNFRGPLKKIEEAMWRDYFFNCDWSRTISIVLEGTGPESRSVIIGRGETGRTLIPLEADRVASASSAISFQWKDNHGHIHDAVPIISASSFQFPDTSEDLPDFFFFGANQTYSSVDNADRFSDLGNRKKEFIKFFIKEYPRIEDLSIESRAGSPAIYATLKNFPETLPITSVSGGINRMITILLAMASRQQSVILIDEGENGLFHSHHKSFWKTILEFAARYNSQLFLTTHSEEWLEALADVADAKKDDVALWRAEGADNGPIIRQFDADTFIAGIETGGEVR